MSVQTRILPLIVLAQFFCTSLWFASNGIIIDLIQDYGLKETALGHLTSAVQFGFITGTLTYAVLTIADRFSPSRVFFISAILGAFFNLALVFESNTLASMLVWRFFTGFFLAGIYPVGMKIAADYFEKGLGKSLGFLVGALVLGTGFPHALNLIGHGFSWRLVIYGTSILAFIGGLIILLSIPDGPFRKPGYGFDPSAFIKVFKIKALRKAAFGYFGHMWELYAFWAFVPILIIYYMNIHNHTHTNTALLSFIVIAMGFPGCVCGAYLAERWTTEKTAFLALAVSAFCCLMSLFAVQVFSLAAFIVFLLIWGTAVIADSPLFSTLVAQNAPGPLKATALTIVNCTGFAISIISIQLLTYLNQLMDIRYIFIFLAIGPVVSLIFQVKNHNK